MISFTAYATPDAEEMARQIADETDQVAELLSCLARLIVEPADIADLIYYVGQESKADRTKLKAFAHMIAGACGEDK